MPEVLLRPPVTDVDRPVVPEVLLPVVVPCFSFFAVFGLSAKVPEDVAKTRAKVKTE